MNQKTAAIYDRWLYTLGGGEQVAFAYAQCLLEMGYKVDLITHKLIDPQKAEEKMGVSLKDINIIYLLESSGKKLSRISSKYDVFINTSHLDYFPNGSKNGILSVFFPGIVKLSIYEHLKRAFFIPSFKKMFIYPSSYEGFSFDEYKNGKIYKWLSKNSSIIFRNNIEKFSITLYLEYFTFAITDEIIFTLNDKVISPTSKSMDANRNNITFSFNLKNIKFKKFSIRLPKHPYSKKVALVALTIPNIRFFLYNIFKKFFPVWEMRLHGGPGVTKLSDLESYNKIITISEFCKKWIYKYWGLNSKILYPPVNIKNFSPSKKKKNIILHVGRFFITGHSKKQLELAKAFIRLVNKHKVKNWELHFVGSIAEGSNHKNYFDKVVSESKDHAIYFHNNASFIELKQLFSDAKIYWHATGLNEDEDRSPLSMEHFGITTVEAMASGCVPVVINKGGQKEIVTDSCGFKWNNTDELISYTDNLIKNPEKIKKLGAEAIKRSSFFDKSKFKERFKEIIEEE